MPQALSDYRPHVNITAGAGNQVTSQETAVGPALTQKDLWWTSPRSIGITAQQKLFNGFQTANRTRAAESNVLAARETLRVVEQTVLLDAATVYMDVVRDVAILEVQRSNVRALDETVRPPFFSKLYRTGNSRGALARCAPAIRWTNRPASSSRRRMRFRADGACDQEL